MKNKKRYIIGTVLALFTVIYTSVRFTFPTDNEQNASIVSTAFRLVESSFTTIDIYENVTIEEAGIQILPVLATINTTESVTESTEEDAGVVSLVPSSINVSASDASDTQLSLIAELYDVELVTNDFVTTQDSSDTSTESTVADDLSNSDSLELETTATTAIKETTTEETKNEETENEESEDSTQENQEDTVTDSTDESGEEEDLTILSISDSSCNLEDIGISIADSYVNIRKKASTDSAAVGKLYNGAACEITKVKGDWYKITSGTVTGYVKSEYIKTDLTEEELNDYGTLIATVNTDGLNVRKKTDVDSKRVDVIYSGESYTVIKQTDDWVKLNIKDDGVKGYVKTEYVVLSMSFEEAISAEEEAALKKAEEEKEAAKTVSSSTTTENSTSATSDEVKLLACLIQAEAGNQSYEGKLAVANVVLNRVNSSKYPNTISGVIYQSGQFSVASSGSLAKQLAQFSSYSSTSQKLSIQAAKAALAGTNNIGSCLYFNRYSSSLASSKGGTKIQDHLFW